MNCNLINFIEAIKWAKYTQPAFKWRSLQMQNNRNDDDDGDSDNNSAIGNRSVVDASR